MTEEQDNKPSEASDNTPARNSELRWSRPDSVGHIPIPTIKDDTDDFSWARERRAPSGQRKTTVPDDEKFENEAFPELAEGFQDTLIGTLLDGKYRILSVLGYGGMSVVYKAEQELVEKMVAIKTVKFRADERPALWKRFEREVKTLSRLSHENIVTVYDCVLGGNGQPYVVMDYLEGFTLDQVLHERGRFTTRQLLSVASQACAAVGHAHRNDVIHRDIKPANIMLVERHSSLPPAEGEEAETERQYLVKVVDFGLAKLGEDTRKLTATGELWGSPPYMSPEQIVGADCDNRSDIYSLGCVVYEMATGHDPFWGANVYELLHKHLNESPPGLLEACPEGSFPEHLQAVLEKAMAKDSAERFATMGEFQQALQAACTFSPELDLSPPVTRKPGQTGHQLPGAHAAAQGQRGTASGAGTPAVGEAAKAGAAGPAGPDYKLPQPGQSGGAYDPNQYLAWTVTGLLLAACIIFVFNQFNRPQLDDSRRPYHTIHHNIPMAPVPPPVASLKQPVVKHKHGAKPH